MPNPRMYEGPEVGSSEDEEITEAEVGWDMGAIEVSVPTNGGSDANVGITLGMENGEIFIESVDETGPFASQIGKFPPRARLLQVNHQDTSEVTDLYVLYDIIREAQGGLTLKIKEAPARRAVTPAALESTPDDPQTMPSDIDYKDQYLTVTEILERQRQRASEELQQGVGRGVAMAATAVNVVPLVQASEVNTAADTVDDTRDPSSNNQGGSVTKKGDSSTRKGDSSIQETTSSAASPPKRWKLYTGILVLVCAVGAVIGVLMSGGSSSSGSDNKALESEPAGTDQEQADQKICIHQADFASGTLIIDTPGQYKLCEDITFSPNELAEDVMYLGAAFRPVYGDKYDPNSYGIGFFAAIVITADNVDLFLDGHKLEQSLAHLLMQPFFANIELSSAPFMRNFGPAQFVGEGDLFTAAKNVRIIGPGVIGRSTHHGIHGNNNANIQIHNVTFRDFGVAAVSLNNVDGLEIRDNRVEGNFKDFPVNGLFRAATSIRPYGSALKALRFEMMLRGERKTAAEVYDALAISIDNVYHDIIHGTGYQGYGDSSGSGYIDESAHPTEFWMFNNNFRVMDGPCYAFLVHGFGPAIDDFGFVFDADSSRTSSNVVIENNSIMDIQCYNREIPAAVINGQIQNDVRGSIFQLVDTVDKGNMAIDEDGTYKGNVLSDMQIMVSKAIKAGVLVNSDLLQTDVDTIHPSIVQWAESGTTTFSPAYRCNGDSMHHVTKGMVVIRIDGTQGFENPCVENPEEQGIGNIRMISIAASRPFDKTKNSVIEGNFIRDANSFNPNHVIGIDIQGETTGISILRNDVDLRHLGQVPSDKHVGLRIRNYVDGTTIKVSDDNIFAQGIQDLSFGRRLRKPSQHPPPHAALGQSGCPFARNTGGCPFARKLATGN